MSSTAQLLEKSVYDDVSQLEIILSTELKGFLTLLPFEKNGI